jgi:serine/threonine protein kinase
MTMLADIPTLLPGTTITFPKTTEWPGSEIKIKQVIGRGGTAVIYSATSERGGDLAVKAPLNWRGGSQLLAETKWVVGRAKEDKIGRALSVSTYAMQGITVPIMLTTLFSGGNLYDHVSTNGKGTMETIRVARIIADVALALYAMECCHRDLKPENIMLDSAGEAYVIDFGIAMPADPKVRKDLDIKISAIVGTAPYLSYEQLNENETMDQRSDIFTLGLIAYELLTGKMARPPRGNLSERAWLLLIYEWDIAYAEVTDKRMRRVIETCTKRKRASRYQSHLDLVADLEDIIENRR